MQAELFYTRKNVSATPLVPVACADIQTLPAEEKVWLDNQQFSGKCGEIAFLYDHSGGCKKLFLGLGDNPAQALAVAATKLPLGTYQLTSPLPVRALMQWSLAQYRFDAFKKQMAKPRILVLNESIYEDLMTDVSAIYLVRDLINQPANILGPEALSAVVKNLAQSFGATFKEWVGEELLQANFPAIHAVGKAAAQMPRLLTLTWGEKNHPKIALVGKGVCFDSGGLDLKNSGSMRLMKKDMGGAAQVTGLAQWIMQKKLPIHLSVYIPAVENAIGSRAYRPGDVINMRNGLTVEIDNTDAEGRLVLADALSLACEQDPDLIFDFSTLTGAARTAVGTEIAAMFTNNNQVALDLAESSEKTGDMIWRMPLHAPYASMLDSSIADLSNCSPSPYAGAILAALFLQRFIKADLPWIHFDIMAWNVGNKPGKPEGGEAMGMLAVGDYLLNKYSLNNPGKL